MHATSRRLGFLTGLPLLVAAAYPVACVSTPTTVAPVGVDAGPLGCAVGVNGACLDASLPVVDAASPDASPPACPLNAAGVPACDAGQDTVDAALPDAGADASPATDSGAPPPATGTLKWGSSFAGGAWIAQSIVDGQGNRYFVGHPVSGTVTLAPGVNVAGAYVAKVDATGALVWATPTGASYGYGIAIDSATGTVYATLGINGQVTVGGTSYTSLGQLDFLIAKFDASGNVVAAKQFGGAGNEQAFAMGAGGGRISVTGTASSGTADFGGGVLTPTAQGSAFELTVDSSLAYVTAAYYGGPIDSGAYGSGGSSVAVDAAGNTYACGEFSGTTNFGAGPVNAAMNDGYLVSLGPTGAYRWSHLLGSQKAGCSAITVGPDGNVYASGSFYGSADLGNGTVSGVGGQTGWVASYTAAGAYRWASMMSSDTLISIPSIAADRWGEVAVTGYFMSSLTVGKSVFAANSEENGFLAKLDASGNFLWSQQWKGGVDVQPYTVDIDDNGVIGVGGTYFGGPMILSATTTLPGVASAFYAFFLLTEP